MIQAQVRANRKTARVAPRDVLAEEAVGKKRRPNGFFKKMSDNEFLGYAQGVINKNKIKRPKGLKKVDVGLYNALQKRGLLDQVYFEKKQKHRAKGFFKKMSDKELVKYAQGVVNEKKVKKSTELQKVDGGLYRALWKRKLLGEVEFEEGQRPPRHFKKMSDEELVEYAQKVIWKEGVKGPVEFRKADCGLYHALWKRGLLGALRFKERKRSNGFFKEMSDKELVKYAKKVVDEKKVKTPEGLKKLDGGLHRALCKRGLMKLVFADVKKQEILIGLNQAAEAMQKFGERG